MSFIPRNRFVRSTLALAALCTTGVVLHAQTSQAVSATGTSQIQATPPLNLELPLNAVSGESSSSQSSSSTDSELAVNANHINFVDAMQYGGRPRYGKPRYRGGNTNKDGSAKYIGYGAGGFTQPVGDTWHIFTPSWGIEVGGGRQFSKHFALPIEFDYDHFGLTKQTLDNQFALYNTEINDYCGYPVVTNPTCTEDGISPFTSLDGNAHVWSFSIDPTYTFYQADGVGAYVVGGVGFYHKVSNFTTPEVEEDYSPYYGYEEYSANAIVDHYTSNAPGFSGGLGFTYKFSRFSNQRLFAEARYVVVLNSQRQGVTINNLSSANEDDANDFPQNSNRTTYFPIKFGIRF